jgi:hypothetical protein
LHFLNSDPACGFNAASHNVSRFVRVQALCRMIRLACPRRRSLFDELDTTAVDYVKTGTHCAQNDESGPTGVSFQPEGNSHCSHLTSCVAE